MSHIHRPQIIFTLLCIGLSACAAPTEIPIPAPTITATQLPTASPTLTSTPTSTPEPTATPMPEPELIVQQEVTFDLSDGTKLPLTCFLKNTPQTTDEELLETVLKYFVDRGVDWGNPTYAGGVKGSEEWYKFTKRLNMIPGKDNSFSGIAVRPAGGEYEEFFGLIIMGIPYKSRDITLLSAKAPDKDFPKHYACADIDPQIVSSLIINQQISIPRKPID